MKEDVLNAVRLVKVRGEQVEVRELTWKDYVRAVKQMTGTILGLIGDGGKISMDAIVLNREKLTEAIGAQEDLVAWVLAKSTSRDQAWVDSLSAREVLPLLDAVIELNLSPEVIEQGKKLAGQMGEAFGLKKASVAPATISSAPATASVTSKK